MFGQVVELVLLTVAAMAFGAMVGSLVTRATDTYEEVERTAGRVPYEAPLPQPSTPYYYPWPRPTAERPVAEARLVGATY